MSDPKLATPAVSWRDAFPMNEAQRAVAFLASQWKLVSAAKPKAFASTLLEPKITEWFCLHLQTVAVADGKLTGWYTLEEHSGQLDGIKVVRRIRKDITYKSNANNVRLSLTFEFKKIDATASKCGTYRGKSGMRRFIDGDYDKDQPLALMVGMVEGDVAACHTALCKSLETKASQKALAANADSTGKCVVSPSVVFPGVAAFDTSHQRPSGHSTHNTMVLAHLLLQMPA